MKKIYQGGDGSGGYRKEGRGKKKEEGRNLAFSWHLKEKSFDSYNVL